MTFGEKLSFLMEITNTNNITLSKATGMDTSAISLYRNGKRKAPRNKEIMGIIASYFADNIIFDYQKSALASAADYSVFSRKTSKEEFTNHLKDWLEDNLSATDSIPESFSPISLSSVNYNNSIGLIPAPDNSSITMFGLDGKRQAFLSFLDYVLKSDSTGNIYIWCEDDWNDFFSDVDFHKYIMHLTIKVLEKGNTITQVINQPTYSTRFFEEFFGWVPAYLSGQVNAVYYPRIRDGLYCRALLLFPGHIVVYNSTLQSMITSPNSLTVLSTESSILKVKEAEIVEYVSMCKPIMNVYSDLVEISQCFSRFISTPCSHIQKGLCLPIASLPYYIIESLSYNDENRANMFKLISEDANNGLEKGSQFTSVDICPLASVEQIQQGIIPIIYPLMDVHNKSFYTPKIYADHLKNVLKNMEDYPNYFFVPIPYNLKDEVCFLVNNDSEAILIKTTEPFMVFDFTLSPIVTQIQDYLYQLADKVNYSDIHRRKIQSQIKDLITALEKL